MAGSYSHVTTDSGQLRAESFGDLIENLGDAYEVVEEMYGMIWWLASVVAANHPLDSAELVRLAEENYRVGLGRSPGVERD